jgi:hypothetical protein
LPPEDIIGASDWWQDIGWTWGGEISPAIGQRTDEAVQKAAGAENRKAAWDAFRNVTVDTASTLGVERVNGVYMRWSWVQREILSMAVDPVTGEQFHPAPPSVREILSHPSPGDIASMAQGLYRLFNPVPW